MPSGIMLLYIMCTLVGNSACTWSELMETIKYNTISFLGESCDKRWVTQDFRGLSEDLKTYVFGQDLATETIISALRSHVSKQHRKKPLVINFHGSTGSGKGYVADFIIKHWFKEGDQSSFVKTYIGKLNFAVKDKLHEYEEKLQQDLEETIKKCSKAMFIFDEVDKFIPQVLDAIKPYLDYSSSINGLDFRQSIFILITNTGYKKINQIAFDKLVSGGAREELSLADFENALKTLSYNENGTGLFHSDLITHHLIDYTIPFLPLEQRHVESCIEAEMSLQGVQPNKVAVREVLKELSFGPPPSEFFSITGCKRVHEKVGQFIERERRKRRMIEL